MNNKKVTRFLFALIVSASIFPSLAAADSGHCGSRGPRGNGYSLGPNSYRPNPWQARPSWNNSGWSNSSWGNSWQNNYNYQNNYSHQNPGYGFRGNASSLIQQGVRDGRLSQREQQELANEARNIRWQRANYARDGYIDRRERERLQDSRQDFYRDLNHELNDGEYRRHW